MAVRQDTIINYVIFFEVFFLSWDSLFMVVANDMAWFCLLIFICFITLDILCSINVCMSIFRKRKDEIKYACILLQIRLSLISILSFGGKNLIIRSESEYLEYFMGGFDGLQILTIFFGFENALITRELIQGEFYKLLFYNTTSLYFGIQIALFTIFHYASDDLMLVGCHSIFLGVVLVTIIGFNKIYFVLNK